MAHLIGRTLKIDPPPAWGTPSAADRKLLDEDGKYTAKIDSFLHMVLAPVRPNPSEPRAVGG